MADTKTKAQPTPKEQPATTTPVTDKVLQTEARKEAMTFIQKLKSEPIEKVHGAKVFKKTLGDFYTFLINNYSVTIYFDGTYQEYPASIARLLRKKLDEIAVSVSPVNENVKL